MKTTKATLKRVAAERIAGGKHAVRVIRLEDMTDEQKKIVAAGFASATLPVPDLPEGELKEYFVQRVLGARAARDAKET